ncbi:polyprenyl synthetase family protein [Pseudosporangium ferrugineum]|uniref:Geranylgeranyl diphosphate synthase type I n=1 Tax=Pseudosporangium ferrugineum TaxID=439699 RepID=A0A2T0R992_9ACTN|nr:geranylgeranyl diphosphate synthase type I [Pseudosporangium ferrugineum]
MANDILEGTRRFGVPHQPIPADGLVNAVEGTLAEFLAGQIAALDAVDPALGMFARTTRDLVLAGGKRLRPTFAYWGWRGMLGSREPVDSVLPALAALELMHTFALVHDDVMDGSATRRGRPTAHRLFATQHEIAGRSGDSEQFGSTSAILVGDLCLVWADQLLAQTAVTTATLFGVRACYDRMRVEAVAGQYLDVLGETQPDEWSLERALVVARHKTASYTVQRPLQFGLALAGPMRRMAPAINEAYDSYGIAVGEAFQLRDDLLGVYGDPKVTGKPASDDLRTRKPTALLMLAHRLATPAQRAELAQTPAGAVIPADGSGGPLSTAMKLPGSARDVAVREAATDEALSMEARIARQAEVIAETGAVSQVEAMIRQRVDQAVSAIQNAPIHHDARAALIDLAMTATHRPA